MLINTTFIDCKKWIFFFVAGLLIHFSSLASSVVIVGGGPVGLATAIEAKESGAEVTVVEKREKYLRSQVVFLDESSLRLLAKWEINPAQMHIVPLENNERMAFVRINHLEEALAERVHQLGIRILHGEFKDLKEDEKQIIVSTDTDEFELPYHILVGADGLYSQVRAKAALPMNHMGRAVGISAVIAHETPSKVMNITPSVEKNGYFIRKIDTPSVTIIFAQTSIYPAISQKELEELIREVGWNEEAHAFAENRVKMGSAFEILLQQAIYFSNPQKSVIVVGDAAATASFFEGMGLNTGLKTAALAGEFFKSKQDKEEYALFDQNMKEATDQLIDKNRYLFVMS